jgi:proline iminopeptidase
LPDAELVIVEDSGHTGSDTMRVQVRNALDRFADRRQNRSAARR